MTVGFDIKSAKKRARELRLRIVERKYIGVSEVYTFVCLDCSHKFRTTFGEVLGGKECASCKRGVRARSKAVSKQWKVQAALVLTARGDCGFSQMELASKVGFTKVMVFNWESGKTQVPVKTIAPLPKSLKIKKGSLISAIVKDFENHLVGNSN
jgi:ribosome-binding protein aMBF1 (putative translation factor)